MTLNMFFNSFETHFIVHKTSDGFVDIFTVVCKDDMTWKTNKAKHCLQNGGVPWTFPFSGIDFDHVSPEFSSLQTARANLQGLFSPIVAPPLIISVGLLDPR